MKYASAATSFIVVFVLAFFLGGYFLMPYLPPTPDHPVHFFDNEYWTTNWAGAVLGIVMGGLSARTILKKKNRANQ